MEKNKKYIERYEDLYPIQGTLSVGLNINRKIIKFKCLFFKNVIQINKRLTRLMRKTKHPHKKPIPEMKMNL